MAREPDIVSAGPLASRIRCVVVDTETTGTDPVTDRIIEIGAVRVEAGEIVAHFNQLVDPARPIPGRITRLTGIGNRDVAGMPTISESLRALAEFVGDDVLVAHNAPFDSRFLALEAARVEFERGVPWSRDVLCTLRLARRLLPGLRSKGLASLCSFYGIPVARRHRAHDDAAATAEVLLRMCPVAESHGVHSLDELVALQRRPYSATGAVSAVVERLKKEVLPTVPERPGVYHFVDGRGRLLYVGKAACLRTRVRQYLVGVEGLPERTRGMLEKARDVQWTELPCELQAMLVENEQIKTLRPPFNRAQKNLSRRPYIALTDAGLSVSTFPGHSIGHVFGPFKNGPRAYALAQMAAGLSGLPFQDGRRPRSSNDRARKDRERAFAARLPVLADFDACGFLSGHVAPYDNALQAAIAGASAEMAFEEAAIGRDWRELLARLAQDPSVGAPRMPDSGSALILNDAGALTIAVVGSDRLEGVYTTLATAREGVTRLFEDAGEDAPFDEVRKMADELHVVSHWAFRHRDLVVRVGRRAGDDEAGFMDRIDRAVSNGAMQNQGIHEVGVNGIG